MNKRRWSRGEKWMIALSCGVCLPGLLLGWIYERQNELPPAPTVVAEVPPANNAFDVLMSALTITTASPRPAVTVSGSCTSSGVDREFTCGALYSQPQPYTPQYNRAFPLNQKTAYLQQNQSALKLWRSSLNLPLYIPHEIPQPQRHLWFTKSEALEVAIRTQARACWQRRDNNGALGWILNHHRAICRRTVSFYNGNNHPVGISSLKYYSRQRQEVLNELQGLMPYLSAAQLRLAALSLQHDCALLPSTVASFDVTRRRFLSRAYRICAANDLRLAFDEQHPEQVEVGQWKQMKFHWMNKRNLLKRVNRLWDWSLSQAKLPVNQQTFGGQFPDDLRIELDDTLADLTPYNTNNPDFSEIAHVDANEVVLLSAMAARAFQLEQRRNPLSLNELVPRYLQRVEADPFDTSHSLQYEPKPKTYTTVEIDKPIYTLPLPKNAVAIPPGSNVAGQKTVTGYSTIRTSRTLPFLLYSVGTNGKDEGGMNFKNAFPSSPSSVDDVLAPPEWFQKPK